MTPETKAFIDACEERANKATDGPWFAAYRCVHSKPLSDESIRLEELIPAHADDNHPAMKAWNEFPDSDVCAVPAAGGDTPTRQGAKDAEFIAHARADVPELIRIIREQDAEMARMQKTIDAQKVVIGGLFIGVGLP